MLRIIERHPALKHITQLLTGTAMAQAIPILVSPVLTRLYGPRAFGELGIFAALLMGLSLVVSGRFEIAVPIPPDDETAFELVALSLGVTVASSSALLLLAVVAAVLVLPAHPAALSPFAALALPFGILFASAQQSFAYWLTRMRRFPVLARARVAQGVVTAALSILLGVWTVAPEGLIVGLVAGYATAFAMLAWETLPRESHRFASLSLAGLRGTARRFSEFPTLNTSNALVDTARDSGTLIVFSALFGVSATGLLSQALRIARAPMSLIGQSVGQVFYQRATSARAGGDTITSHVRRTMLGMFAIAVPLYLVILLFGPALFALLFGEQWRQAGEFARLLTPWLLLNFVLSPLSLIPVMTGHQGTALRLNLADTALRLGGIAVGARFFGGARGALLAFAVSGCAIACVQLLWYVRLGRETPSLTRSAA